MLSNFVADNTVDSSNLHTVLTMTETMMKFVAYLAFVAYLIIFASCENRPVETIQDQNVNQNTSTLKKKAEAKNNDLIKDSLSSDLSQGTDSTINDSISIASLSDSAIIALPLPDEESGIEWESESETDTLDSGFEEESTEEWLEETSGEEESEYIDYSNNDVPLNRERILKTEIVKVKMPDSKDERDSVLAVIEERMRLNPDQISKQIVVEKWFSPVNYRGYKFNRKKLMLYGVEKEALISIYFYLGEYYFAFNQKLYNLDETAKNSSFERVQDAVVTNFLLKYEN